MEEASRNIKKEKNARAEVVEKVKVEKPKKKEMPPPPERPKKKKKAKKKEKAVPTSELENNLEKENPSDQESKGESEQASTGDMRLDAPEFPFGYYLVTIRRKIAGNWSVPKSSGSKEISCRVYFRISRSGQIQSPGIEQSSGSFLFDQAALRAVIEASPLPPLPGEYRDDYLGVHFSFAYEER